MFKSRIIKRGITISLLFVVSAFLSRCGSRDEIWFDSLPGTGKSPVGIIKGPYLQNFHKTSVTVMWESSDSLPGIVLYGLSSDLENKAEEKSPVKVHEIPLTDLLPDTQYYYQVKSGAYQSRLYSFRTFGDSISSFSFAIYGDNKEGPFIHRKIASLILKRKPAFIAHNGDIVDRGKIYLQWGKLFFSSGKELFSKIPLFTVLGNHEDESEWYFRFFSLPGNEKWYSFDFGKAHFVFLYTEPDTDADMDSQLVWLERDLSERKALWTFVFMHHPLFSSGGAYYARDRIQRKNLLHPLFDKYDVDIVFSGHDHDYERTQPIVRRDDNYPVTYIICGNGGTPLRYIGKREWSAFSRRIFGFVMVSLQNKKLNVRAFDFNDKLIDEFVLDKSDSASLNEYRKRAVVFESVNDPESAARNYSKGKKLMKKKDYREAIPFFRKALASDSTCAEAMGRMAECYRRLDSLDLAEKWALKTVEIMPVYPLSYECLLKLYATNNQPAEIEKWFDQWKKITPFSPDPYETRAKLLEKRGYLERAIFNLKKAVELLPSDSDLLRELGDLFMKKGDTAMAEKCYKRSLEWWLGEKESDRKDLLKKLNRIAGDKR